jgi:hypothetical protein
MTSPPTRTNDRLLPINVALSGTNVMRCGSSWPRANVDALTQNQDASFRVSFNRRHDARFLMGSPSMLGVRL